MKILIWVVVNAVALGVAVWLFDGITLTGDSDLDRFLKLLVVGLIFGLITAFVRPIVNLISLPLIVLTLGLMLLVVNALMLMLTSAISGGSEPRLPRRRLLDGAVRVDRHLTRLHPPRVDLPQGRPNLTQRTDGETA